jgi:hypothetical protein
MQKMKYSIIPLISLMLWVGSSLPGRSRILAAARSPQISPENPETVAQNNPPQTEITKAEILNACIQERAENLPQLYSDVPANHWAFKAVQTMAYCGAYRSATPPDLIEELLNSAPNETLNFGDNFDDNFG